MTTITEKPFGTTKNGEAVSLFTLDNGTAQAEILSLGGIIRSIRVPDKNGVLTDVALGYETAAEYGENDGYLGALIGRNCNRTARGRFTLNGKEYTLYCNDGNNNLHGGKVGFNSKLWNVRISGEALVLSYSAADGEEGYPGSLDVTVTYRLAPDNTLSLDYRAVAGDDTVCNLTNHCYFNLNGQASGSVESQKIQVFGDFFTESDAESLTTGNILPVQGTPLDLRRPVAIGAHIDDAFEQLQLAGGYDHNWVINGTQGELRPAACAVGNKTGITLAAATTLPGVQLYTGNYLSSRAGKDGARYNRRQGFCLESQYYPNALEHPAFPQPILRRGETYHAVTTYRFGVEK